MDQVLLMALLDYPQGGAARDDSNGCCWGTDSGNPAMKYTDSGNPGEVYGFRESCKVEARDKFPVPGSQ